MSSAPWLGSFTLVFLHVILVEFSQVFMLLGGQGGRQRTGLLIVCGRGFPRKVQPHASQHLFDFIRPGIILFVTKEIRLNPCIIVGFELFKRGKKLLFKEDECSVVENINPYLIAYKDIIIDARSQALCDVPPISVGSFAVDGGNLIMNEEESQSLIKQDETLSNFIRRYYSPEDFIQGKPRYCFWLKDIPLSILRSSAILRDRLKAVQAFRSASKKIPTQKKAATPWLFGEERQPDSDYILIPRTSSESRAYIPMGFMPSDVIAGDTIILPNATLYHFGILTSSMHMA